MLVARFPRDRGDPDQLCFFEGLDCGSRVHCEADQEVFVRTGRHVEAMSLMSVSRGAPAVLVYILQERAPVYDSDLLGSSTLRGQVAEVLGGDRSGLEVEGGEGMAACSGAAGPWLGRWPGSADGRRSGDRHYQESCRTW